MHEWDKCNLYLVYFSLYSFITCPTEEKRPKVKKPKFEFPVYEPAIMDTGFLPSYDQGTSIEEIEDQMDHWLDDSKSEKKKVICSYFFQPVSFLPIAQGHKPEKSWLKNNCPVV